MDTRSGRNVKVLASSVVATLLAAAAMAAAPASGPASGPASAPAVDQHGPTLVDTYKGHFLIGTAIDNPNRYAAVIKENFNVITPENCMKPAPIHPSEAQYNYGTPDAMVKWCQDNNIKVHGHTLLWHSQTNNWFFDGGDKATIAKRLEDHVKAVVGHFKGKLYSIDVVNESINDGGGGGRGGAAGANSGENLRTSSPWVQNLGPELFNISFKAAHEADPDLKLYYNDYNIESGAKHTASMALLKRLKADGLAIYGVGIQGHWSTGTQLAPIDQAITDYASLGLKVSISELDVTINGVSGGQLNPAGGGAPGGGRRGGAGTAPATAPAGAFFDGAEDSLFYAAAPAGPAGAGGGAPGAGAGGPGGGGMGGGGMGGGGMGGGGGGGGAGRGGRGGGGGGPSAAGLKAQADFYARLFAIFEKHKDVVERVTFWGVNDAVSWRGAASAPLILDGNNQRKPCYVSIVEALLHPDPNLAAPK